MSDYQNIKSIIDDNKDIITKKENAALPFIYLIAGLAVIILSFFIEAGANILFALLVVGIVLFIAGFISLCRPKRYKYYLPSNEKLKEYIYYFDSDDKKNVSEAIKSGNINLLKSLKSASTNMRVVVYTTGSHSYSISQMQIYIPYEYVPVEHASVSKR